MVTWNDIVWSHAREEASSYVANKYHINQKDPRWDALLDKYTLIFHFRDGMVKWYRTHKTRKTYKVIGWKDRYSPILDVTKICQEVDPSIQSAKLTIEGSNIEGISYTPRDEPFPERTPEEIVNGWKNGYELERMGRIDDYFGSDVYFEVRFPVKLEIKQKHPPAPSIKKLRDAMVNWYKTHNHYDKDYGIYGIVRAYTVIGWANEYSPILDVTGMVRFAYDDPQGYQIKKATLTIWGHRLDKIKLKGPYYTKPRAFGPDEIVGHWMNHQEWERAYWAPTETWYYVIFPCDLHIETYKPPTPHPTPKPKPQPKPTPSPTPTPHPTPILPQPTPAPTPQPTNIKPIILGGGLIGGGLIAALLIKKLKNKK